MNSLTILLISFASLSTAVSEKKVENVEQRTKRQVYQPAPHVDEKLVSAFINNPEAVKMVLSYLNKQKATPTPTTTPRTTPRPTRKRKRPPPPPPLSFFFGGKKPLSQLIQEHRDTLKQINEKSTSTSKSTEVKPILTEVQKKDHVRPPPSEKVNLQFFGPKDFVPKKAYQPPLGPMRLKYASTQEFPTRTYGRLVPMPR